MITELPDGVRLSRTSSPRIAKIHSADSVHSGHPELNTQENTNDIWICAGFYGATAG